jgi:hypothetical protein
MTIYIGVVIETIIYDVQVEVDNVIDLEGEMQRTHVLGKSRKRQSMMHLHPLAVADTPPSIADIAKDAAEKRAAENDTPRRND